ALTQGLNQILYFPENPDQADLALRAAVAATGEIQEICREHGIDWLAAYLPSAFDFPSEDWRPLRKQAQELLELDDADFEIANRLGDRLLASLRERGIE